MLREQDIEPVRREHCARCKHCESALAIRACDSLML
jgi:hypothetical protein